MIITEYVVRRGKVVKVGDLSPSSCIKVEVRCPECLKTRSVHYRSIAKAGHTICQSCSMKQFERELAKGERYEKLTIIGKGTKSGYSLCRCDCGEVKEIYNRNILAGQKSCGCIKKQNFNNVNRPAGVNHPNWKGGASSERERTMQTLKYRTWRDSVFERDNCICQKCKDETKKPETHHIEDYETNEDLRMSVDNGITFCGDCHRLFHKIYGRKNTNKRQLEEFM